LSFLILGGSSEDTGFENADSQNSVLSVCSSRNLALTFS
jgi:hypothetical protein